MKSKHVLILFLLICPLGMVAQPKDTVYVSDFGAKPYTYENCVKKVQAAVDECKRTGAKVLSFEKGRYDLWPEGAIRREYFISNSSSETECPSKVKTVGLHFNGMKNLVIDGNGAMLMFHGKMITMAFEHSDNIRLQNISADFERPTASELCYTKVDDNGVEVTVHPDTRYEIVNGRMNLIGEGWKSNINHCIELHKDTELFLYSQGWNVLASSDAKEISRGVIRFSTPADFKPKVGNILTIRDIIRDQVGMFIFESSNITLNRVNMHYMHGLGIVNQYVNNITMDNVNCSPRQESGRMLTSSADMMHFSGCRGKVTIRDCYFKGAQDDPVNIHGTNLRIVEKVDNTTLKLRFMHHQSYGFNAFFPGDEVAFVRAEAMERFASSKVVSVKRLSDRELLVNFSTPVPANLQLNHDCVENMTCTPEVEIRNSYFTRTSARGVLVTTPRKVVIENNTFYKTGMSAVLIEGDAEGWYESGPVNDVLIRNNTFVDCARQGGPGNAIIALNPSNTVIDANRPVHRNVRIEGNTFNTYDYPVLYAKSTDGLVFKDNKIVRTNTLQPSSGNNNTFYLNGCKNVLIQGTIFEGDVLGRNVKTDNMKKSYYKYSR